MRRYALALALAACATGALAADSSTASLRVGVRVTRRCAVTAGPAPVVRCTRTAPHSATPLVLFSERPGPSPAQGARTTSSAAVVTVLF